MFHHLLLPIDGTPHAEAAFRKALEFAGGIGARATLLHVIPEFQLHTYQVEMLSDTRAQYTREANRAAEGYLRAMAEEALAAGVACDTVALIHDHPYEAIIDTARDKGCDLIAMASHGRRGVAAILLGGETRKVLTHTTIPVLVYR